MNLVKGPGFWFPEIKLSAGRPCQDSLELVFCGELGCQYICRGLSKSHCHQMSLGWKKIPLDRTVRLLVWPVRGSLPDTPEAYQDRCCASWCPSFSLTPLRRFDFLSHAMVQGPVPLLGIGRASTSLFVNDRQEIRQLIWPGPFGRIGFHSPIRPTPFWAPRHLPVLFPGGRPSCG